MFDSLPSFAGPAAGAQSKRGSGWAPQILDGEGLSRRDLAKIFGAGALVLTAVRSTAQNERPAGAADEPVPLGEAVELNLFTGIASDGTVVIVCHRSEMGQGIRTSLAQVLADELEADWQRVRLVQAPGDALYGNQNTDGSRSMRHFFHVMRQLGAAARFLLEQAAAQRWQVPAAEVRARDHQITHLLTGRTLSFAELARDAAALPAPDLEKVALKPDQAFRYVGQSPVSPDYALMARGEATYGIDYDAPDLLHASIERCPVLGGKLKSFDEAAARRQPGVVDVRVMESNSYPVAFAPLHGVAILARTSWQAQQARKVLNCVWDAGANGSFDSASERARLLETVRTAGAPSNGWGAAEALQERVQRSYEQTYSVPYLAHAPMEPPVATARVTGKGCTLWIATQTPQRVREEVAKALGLKLEQVTVHVTLLGGGFGRKAKADYAVEAALLARQTGKPVKVTWTREDDLQFGYFHAQSAQYYKALIGAGDEVLGWEQRTAFPSIMSIFAAPDAAPAEWELDLGFHETPPDVPYFSSEVHSVPASVRIGWVRSVCNIQHAFSRCSFIDELAVLLNRPAPIMQLQLLGQTDSFVPEAKQYKYGNYGETLTDYPVDLAGFRAVVQHCARLGRWSGMPRGEGWGFAAHRSFLSTVAVATRVSVNGGALKIDEVHVVIDCGRAVNPDRVRSQMEGSVIFGLTLALYGEIAIREGRVVTENFDTYRLLRNDETPKIEVHIMPSEARPGGVGEPGVPPVAPSLTNAIFAATGKRYRHLPIDLTELG